MSTSDLLANTSALPAALLPCALLLFAYAAARRFCCDRRTWIFAAGVLLILMALGSFLELLADHYLLSAHMAQHLLLFLIAAPLLWMGTPAELVRRIQRLPVIGAIGNFLLHPIVAFALGVGMMWLWHWPRLHTLAMGHPGLHHLQHLCFLLSGIAFWGPILSPAEEMLVQPVVAVFYLFGACVADTLLGILITFAAPGTFSGYALLPDTLGVRDLLQSHWGLSPETDQQAGGLLMWVPCCFVYVGAVMGVLARFYREEETTSSADAASMNEA